VTKTNSYDKEGQMEYHHSGNAPVYAPNSYGRAYQEEQGPVDNGWESDGELVRSAYSLHAEDDDFGQAHTLVREVYSEEERQGLIETVVGEHSPTESRSPCCRTPSSTGRTSTPRWVRLSRPR
jgi:catalase